MKQKGNLTGSIYKTLLLDFLMIAFRARYVDLNLQLNHWRLLDGW
jgi:hypothetical protein